MGWLDLVLVVCFLAVGNASAATGAQKIVDDAIAAAQTAANEIPLPEARPPAVVKNLVSPAAVDLLVRTEVGSQSMYTRKYERPIWPGGASGVTLGIGYDLGHMSTDVISDDWRVHPQVTKLPIAAGITGTRAKALTLRMQEVRTTYPLAYEVFATKSLVKYYRITRRSFPGFENLPANAQGALVSLVYNRGGAMSGGRRVEMRYIRDVCIPQKSASCVAFQLRKMKSIWKGTDIEAGMNSRREQEAKLAES